jgi:hypothetical protein
MLQSLTFSVKWGGKEKFVARKGGAESEWRNLKRRVKDLFLDERDERPGKSDFEVWVKRGEGVVPAPCDDEFAGL